jgi:hypothetical protein
MQTPTNPKGGPFDVCQKPPLSSVTAFDFTRHYPFRRAQLFSSLFTFCFVRSEQYSFLRSGECEGDCSSSPSYRVEYQIYGNAPGVTLVFAAIASPDTTSSTLRFISLPAELSFEATGCVLPKPFAVTAFDDTPCCTK